MQQHHIILQKCLGEEECSVAGCSSRLTSWLTGSHSQRVVNFCPATAPLLTAREDLGDTKQETLNKWKLWMFISRHSSSPKNPDREVRTRQAKQGRPELELHVAAMGAINGASWIRSSSTTHWLPPLILSHSLQGAWLVVDILVPNGDTKQKKSHF